MQKQKTADDKTPDLKREVGKPVNNARAAAAAGEARAFLEEQKGKREKEKERRRGCCGCC